MRKPETFNIWIVLQSAAGMAMILFFQSALNPMLTFAMTLAFITTPFFAWLNFRLVRNSGLSTSMRLLAWAGLIYLSGFAAFYLIWWLGLLA